MSKVKNENEKLINEDFMILYVIFAI